MQGWHRAETVLESTRYGWKSVGVGTMGRQCQHGWEGNSLLPPTGSLKPSPVNHSLISMNPKSTCSSSQQSRNTHLPGVKHIRAVCHRLIQEGLIPKSFPDMFYRHLLKQELRWAILG